MIFFWNAEIQQSKRNYKIQQLLFRCILDWYPSIQYSELLLEILYISGMKSEKSWAIWKQINMLKCQLRIMKCLCFCQKKNVKSGNYYSAQKHLQ